MNLYSTLSFLFDLAQPFQFSFQDSATDILSNLVNLHNTILYYLIVILIVVTWFLLAILLGKKNHISHANLNHGTLIEIIWTITPALILISIALPSFKLLYMLDEVIDPVVTVKTIGFFFCGQILYILNKRKDTYTPAPLWSSYLELGEKIIKPRFASKLNLVYFYIPNVRANNRVGPHNKEVLSVIFGSLLGDCYGNRKSREGIRFVFKQSIIHKEYLFWLYKFFYERGYCSNNEPRKFSTSLKVRNETKVYHRYEFNTFTFRSFNWIYALFYKKGVKYINPKIADYLSPLALAVWIMDDGCWTQYGVRISTNCFTFEEVKLLVKLIETKFSLNCTIQKIQTPGQYSLYIKADSIEHFKTLVLPYFPKSMHYKLGCASK